MVEYDFYVNAYLGSTIPESNFSGVAARAEAILKRFQKLYQVQSWGENSEKMAVCTMAEALYENQRRRGVRSANVGNVSVQYVDDVFSDKSLWRELYRRASIYLDIYRGVQV